jgi:CRISPR type III-A-associated protein Csm2
MSGYSNNSPGRGLSGQSAGARNERGFAQTQKSRGSGWQESGGADRGRLEDLLKPPAQPVRYFSANDPTAPDATLLGSQAEEVAKKVATVPASQLRRFYGEVMALKRRAELTAISDAEIVAQLTLLRAKAAYTWGRTQGKREAYPEELVAFFNRHAYSVRSKGDFLRGFQPHFEAVMAFHKVFENKRGNAA